MADIFDEDHVVDVKFDDLVGEGKKFSDADALAKGKAEADSFIQRLVQEKEEMRKELDQRLTAEDLLKKITEKSTPAPSPDNQPKKEDIDVNKIVDEKLSAFEAKRRAEANQRAFEDTLRDRLGDDFKTIVNKRAQELDLGPEFVRGLIAQNPTAAIALFDAKPVKDVFDAPPANRLNLRGDAPKQKRNFSHYEAIRKNDPKEYWSPRVQNEMFKQLQSQGDDFYRS